MQPEQQPQQLNKWVITAFIVISFIGFLDATYLAVNHFINTVPPCTIGGCEVVTTSKYAEIFGIPVALMGSLYYLTIFLGSLFFVQTKNSRTMRRVAAFTCVGFIASIYFVYLQAFVLRAYCPYCLFSAATSTLLFVLGSYTMYEIRKIWYSTKQN